MNIFILDTNPEKAAAAQCDKHVTKMVLESGQMLSTAHRVLDGIVGFGPSKSGKTTVRRWALVGARSALYHAVHVRHPCTEWTMESEANYRWHFRHFSALAHEYTSRFGRRHKTWADLNMLLREPPGNIPNIGLTPFRLAMGASPDSIDEANPVESYRKYYQTKQSSFDMKWTSPSAMPVWFDKNE